MGKKLCVRELLKETCEELGKRNPHGGPLDYQVRTSVFNSLTSRFGKDVYVNSMQYNRMEIFEIGDTRWLIGLGGIDLGCDLSYAFHGCSTNIYDCDLFAKEFPINDKYTRNIEQLIKEFKENGDDFWDSLIIGMIDGSLRVNTSNRFGERMINLLQSRIARFAIKPKIEKEVTLIAGLAGNPINERVLYHDEFALYLAGCIENVLENQLKKGGDKNEKRNKIKI